MENLNEDCLDRFVDTVNDTRLKIANAGDFVNEMQMKKDEKIMLSFKLITTLGEQEAEIYV